MSPSTKLLFVFAAAVFAMLAMFTPAHAQTLFEGARLITGDGGVIENSAFVVTGNQITQVGRKGEVRLPAGGTRVDLTGKTVMPALIDAHVHMGYRKGLDFSTNNYTRENLSDILDRFSYYGVAAVLEAGTARSDLPYEFRAKPTAGALFLSAGRGFGMPNAGPGGPMRDSAYGVTTEAEARADVRELAAKKANMVKVWVDDRGGTVEKLHPNLYRAIIDEAHKNNIHAFVHVMKLDDTKDLLRAGADGFTHMVRDRDIDDEMLGLVKARPNVFFQQTLWGERLSFYTAKPAWLDEPILRDTFSSEEIRLLGESFTKGQSAETRAAGETNLRNIRKLKAAGARLVLGTDTGGVSGGQYFGLGSQIELELLVTKGGLTPMEAILAGTRNPAAVLGLDRMGSIAAGKSADFIVLDANPLENISNTRKINTVFLRGTEVKRAALAAKWRGAQSAQKQTLYEGARLITGDGSVIENSAFLVQDNLFTRVGRKGDIPLPAGGIRVDLTGKTVMPTLVDLHGHLGYQDLANGRMSKEMFTRENLIDHLQRFAYNGVGAVVGVGDLVDRSDMKGGRTGWGNVPLRVRDELVPGAAMYKTAGTGMAWPGSGAQGDPSRVDVAYPVMTPAEARAAVDDYVKMKPLFIKIWVDDRNHTKKTLTPDLINAIAEEAHKFGVPVGVHNVTLANAKVLLRAGVEGWLHVPVRQGEMPDAEILGIVKDRVARSDRPVMWMTPALITSWMNTQGGAARPAWLDDPLLTSAYSRSDIDKFWGDPLKKMTPAQVSKAKEEFAFEAKSALQFRAAGMKIVGGTDTGQTRHLMGYFNQLDLESQVAMGLKPMDAIVGATSVGANIAGLNTGLVAPLRQADFIVLTANPLDSISNTRKIEKVYLRGAEVPRAEFIKRWRGKFSN
jgi:imidazolonepropionase-like amidohydrolase